MGKEKLKLRIKDIGLLVLMVLALALPGLANIPVIDRDEARYAQASVQMLESGDYINIRFQDQARNKKPAGAYWLQAASVKLLSDVRKRQIWPHRLPSVLGAILAIIATYLGGVRMLGREAAMIGSALLGMSMIFIFEAHIAKTDALLCGFSALSLATLAHLRNGGGNKAALLFWLALGCAVMIKGPILPLLLILCLTALALWERNAKWMRSLINWPGTALFFLIVLPWTVLIWKETNGAFFTEAIGDDLTPKLKGGHESHGGPPGYHTVATWLMYWPACLFLLPGIAFAIRAARGKNGFDAPVAKSARLLLCWAVPFFLVLEIVPTKLPHYTLPIYPALTLMSAAAVITLSQIQEFAVLRRVNAILFTLISIALLASLLFAESLYGNSPTWSFGILGAAILICLYGALQLWNGNGKPAFIAILVAALLVNIPTYQFTMPSLDRLLVSKSIKASLQSAGYSFPVGSKMKIYSPQFTEPSLVYGLGTDIVLGEADKISNEDVLRIGDLIILDREMDETVKLEEILIETLQDGQKCLGAIDTIKGMNYSHGDDVKLDVLEVRTCPETESSAAPDGS